MLNFYIFLYFFYLKFSVFRQLFLWKIFISKACEFAVLVTTDSKSERGY